MTVLLVSTLIMVGTRLTWYRILPLHLRTLGATDSQVGVVFAVALLLGPAQLLGGSISDRWGRRYAIALPTLILVPILAVGAQAQHWVTLAAMIWLIAIFGGIQSPGFYALLAESATDSDRGRVFGGFYTTTALASMLGPVLGAGLLPWLGIHGLIWINVFGATISGLMRLLLLKEGQFATDATRNNRTSIRGVLRHPLIQRLILVNSLFLILTQGITRDGPFIALHAADTLHMNEQAINLLFAVGGVGAIGAALVGGTLTDRIGGRRISAIALGLHVLLLLAWSAWSGQGWVGYTLFGMSWITLQVGVVGYSTWYSAFAPPVVRGRVLGFVGAIASLVSAAGPQVGTWIRTRSLAALANTPASHGILYERLASATPFVLALVFAGVLAALVLSMPGRQDMTGQDFIEKPITAG